MACPYAAEVGRIRAASSAIVGPDARVAEGEKVLRTPPTELSLSSGVSLEVYALGRMVASEWASGPAYGLLAVAEVARNTAKARGVSIFELLTNDRDPSEAGLFGAQGGPTARWASTARPPTERAIAAAMVAVGGQTAIAGGAMRFVHPRAFPTLARALEVYDSWTGEGWRFVARAPVYLDWCLDPADCFLLGKSATSVGTASVAAGRRILEHAGIA